MQSQRKKPDKHYHLNLTNLNTLFNHKEELSERDQILRDALNQKSSMAKLYQFSDDDNEQLAQIKSEQYALQEKLNELGLLQKSLMEKRSKILVANNQELTDLLSAKINQASSYPHKIECDVNRKKRTVTICISDCTLTDDIEKMIGKFLNEKVIIEKHKYLTAEGTDPAVTVTLQFYQADDLIKALKADNSVFSIPRAGASRWY